MTEEPHFIAGGISTDERGSVRFVNSFEFTGVRRFYQLTNASPATARSWRGHKLERKWVYVAKGTPAWHAFRAPRRGTTRRD